jgi:hypothetical protein
VRDFLDTPWVRQTLLEDARVRHLVAIVGVRQDRRLPDLRAGAGVSGIGRCSQTSGCSSATDSTARSSPPSSMTVLMAGSRTSV